MRGVISQSTETEGNGKVCCPECKKAGAKKKQVETANTCAAPSQTKGNEVKLPSLSRKAAVTFTIALGSNTKYGHLMKAVRMIYLNERAKMSFDADVQLQEV